MNLLLSAPPDLFLSKLVQDSQGCSSRRPRDEFSDLRKRYWRQHLWTRGYFCATVGGVDEQTIPESIENQKWHEDDQGFKITAPAEPRAARREALPAASASRRDFQSQRNPTALSR